METMDSDEIYSLDYEMENLPITSLYSKTYCRTYHTANVFEYVWKLDHFDTLQRNVTIIHSTEFPEAGQYKLEMRVFHEPTEHFPTRNMIKFYMLTERPFRGVCEMYIAYLGHRIPCLSKAGYIDDGSCLLEIKASTLLQYVKEGTLTLTFTITVFRDIISESLHMRPIALDTINTKNERKYDNLTSEEISLSSPFVIFQMDNETHKVSKQLLSAIGGSYFSLICKTYEKGKEDDDIKVIIDDISDAFLIMLKFIKTGALPERICRDDVKISELLAVAYRYDVKDLKIICERYLVRNINIINAMKYLDIAIKFEAKNLEEHTMAFIKFNLDELMETEEFEELPRPYLRKLMKSLTECKVSTKYMPIFEHSEPI